MINGNSKERSGGRYIILGCIFAKVLKGSKCFLTRLDLVDEQQSLTWDDALSRTSFNRTHDRMGIETARKVCPSRPIVLKINVDNRFEKILRVRPEQIGLATLAHALNQQRLSIDFVSPFLKEPVCFTAHERPFLMNYCLTIF